MKESMRIIHIAAELAPIAKVGGLGDVLLGLSRETSRLGHDVTIILPKYGCLDSSALNLKLISDTKDRVWEGSFDNVRLYFIEPHAGKGLFDRDEIYGYDDDIARFLAFSRAAADFVQSQNLQADTVHLHDWQTAVIASLLADNFRTVLTIHNLQYQGICSPADLRNENFPSPEGNVNLLKKGILAADAITTVSPTYAQEVMTPEFGYGLEKTLQQMQHKFVGILNGIDYTYWNPAADHHLPTPYSADAIEGKTAVKEHLRMHLGLESTHRPIVGCVTRLVPQKGVELIERALFQTLDKEGQFVLLGSSPIPEIDATFRALQSRFAKHPHVHIALDYDEPLAHLIFGGSDLFIVPSLFEPCGLTQMIALRYGAVPLVRHTGGLADTIVDIDNSPEGNGYVFNTPSAEAIDGALHRAITRWHAAPKKWSALMHQGMQHDFSWSASARKYLDIYGLDVKKV